MNYLEFITIVGLICLVIANQNRIAGQFGLGSDAAREPYQKAALRWARMSVAVLVVGGAIGVASMIVGGVK